jgi:hypothetical protein
MNKLTDIHLLKWIRREQVQLGRVLFMSMDPPMPTPPPAPTNSNATPSSSTLSRVQQWAQRNKVAAGCVGLIAACVICGCFATLVNAVNGGTGTTAGGQTNTGANTSTASATNTPTAPTATPKPKKWTVVQTYNGNGISKTGTFDEKSASWKITWSCNPAQYGSDYNLIADLTQPGQQFGDSVVNVICKNGDASSVKGETMEYQAGTYYLDVNSEGPWQFQIWEMK